MKKKIIIITLSMIMLIALAFAGCTAENTESDANTANSEQTSQASDTSQTATVSNNTYSDNSSSDNSAENITTNVEGSILDVTELFTERDLEQEADLDEATYIDISDNEDVKITEKGVYVISGEATNITIQVDADDEKVQLVLDGVSITNDNMAAINILAADKVFITLTDSINTIEVTGSYEDTSVDSAISSRADLVLNGLGTLEIVSNQGNGITSKDDLKITGGTYNIASQKDGIEANDSIRIYGGNFTIYSNKDALHSENNENESLGYIYIYNGTFNISAADDAIQGNAIVQIDGGVINIITCTEGIEGTYVQINGGQIDIYATDDGINATRKSDYDITIEVNGGDIDVSMAGGDTDAFDANGNLYINGGTINISASSAFDYDNTGEMTGGDVTVNGETVTVLTPSQMPGGPGGGGKPGGGRHG